MSTELTDYTAWLRRRGAGDGITWLRRRVDVLEVRRRLRNEKVAWLAKEFGVTDRAIVMIRDRLSWRHLL